VGGGGSVVGTGGGPCTGVGARAAGRGGGTGGRYEDGLLGMLGARVGMPDAVGGGVAPVGPSAGVSGVIGMAVGRAGGPFAVRVNSGGRRGGATGREAGETGGGTDEGFCGE